MPTLPWWTVLPLTTIRSAHGAAEVGVDAGAVIVGQLVAADDGAGSLDLDAGVLAIGDGVAADQCVGAVHIDGIRLLVAPSRRESVERAVLDRGLVVGGVQQDPPAAVAVHDHLPQGESIAVAPRGRIDPHRGPRQPQVLKRHVVRILQLNHIRRTTRVTTIDEGPT